MNQLSTKRKWILTLIFVLGALSFFAAAACMYVTNALDTLSLVCGAIALLCVIYSVFQFNKNRSAGMDTGDFRRKIVLTFYVLFWMTILIGTNYVVFRFFNTSWDTTTAKQHTLSLTTKQLLSELKTPIKLSAFYVGYPPKYLEDLLALYEKESKGKITTEIIDPIVQIGYAAQFGSIISGKERKLIVQSKAERRDLDFTEEFLSEEKINNALTRVTRKARNIYFLAGHGESTPFDENDKGLNKFAKMLLANNMISHRLLLTEGSEIPKDCDVLVIPGPTSPLSDKETQLIKDFLNQGGDVFFLIEHTVVTTAENPLTEEQEKQNPALNDILNEWGVNVAFDVVVDLTNHASGDVGSPATKNYLPFKEIVKDLDYTFYIRPRSISMLENRRPGIQVMPLVMTSAQQSWGETNRMLEVKFDEGVDRSGPVPIADVMWEPITPMKPSVTRIAVFTDVDFISNAYVQAYSNGEMGLRVINWLSESDYKVLADKKIVSVPVLELTSQQKRLVLVPLALLPFLIICSGLVVWMRRS